MALFGRRIKSQQFDYEPFYYDKKKEDREKRGIILETANDRIRFNRMPKPSGNSGRITLLALVLVLGILTYLYITINQFSMENLPQMSPIESPE